MRATVHGLSCDVCFARYTKTAIAIRLVDPTGLPYLTASTHVPEAIPLDIGDVAIKDYGENTGVLSALVAGGVVEPAHAHFDVIGGLVRSVPRPRDAGAYVGVCRLTQAAFAAAQFA